jgi:hypothetical protein
MTFGTGIVVLARSKEIVEASDHILKVGSTGKETRIRYDASSEAIEYSLLKDPWNAKKGFCNRLRVEIRLRHFNAFIAASATASIDGPKLQAGFRPNNSCTHSTPSCTNR